jgi:hypothetical protein
MCEGHRVIVMNIPGGKGYAPVDLLEAGRYDEAARVARLAFGRNL